MGGGDGTSGDEGEGEGADDEFHNGLSCCNFGLIEDNVVDRCDVVTI